MLFGEPATLAVLAFADGSAIAYFPWSVTVPLLVDGTLVSIILCVLAAVALRYALFYGHPGTSPEPKIEPGSSEAQVRELQVRHQALQDALEREQEAHALFRQSLQPEGTAARIAEQQLAELEHELLVAKESQESLRLQWAHEQALVEEERRHCVAVEQQLRDVTATLSQLRASQAEWDSVRNALTITEQELTAVRTTLEQEQDAHARSQALLREAEATIVRSNADQRFVQELRDQLAGMQNHLRHLNERLGTVTAERDALRIRSDDNLRGMENLRSDLAQTEARGLTLQQQLAERGGMLEAVRAEEAGLREICTVQQDELSAAATKIAELREHLQSLTHENQRLRAELVTAKRWEELLEVKDLELAKQQRQLEQMTTALGDTEARFCEMQSARDTAGQRLRDLDLERSELLHGIQRERECRMAMEADLEHLRVRLDSAERESSDSQELRLRYREAMAQLHDTQDRLLTITDEREILNSQVNRLEHRAKDQQAEYERLEARLGRQDAILRELRIEKEEALTHLERETHEREALERKLNTQIEALEQLRTEHSQSPTRKATLADASPAARILPFEQENRAAETTEELTQDPLRGWIYARPPRHRDDLRRINGIGEIIEGRLNELGVFKFEQIMQWTPTLVAEFSRLLNFRDRIDRDQWVAQARRLFLERRGAAA